MSTSKKNLRSAKSFFWGFVIPGIFFDTYLCLNNAFALKEEQPT